MNSIGERIKESIKSSGLTQKSVSETLSITTQALTNYIKKNRVPEAMILFNISKLCGVHMEWLLTGEEPRFNDQRSRNTTIVEYETNVVSNDPLKITMEDLDFILRLRQLSFINRLKIQSVLEGMLLGQPDEEDQSKQQKSSNSPNTNGREEAAARAEGA